jgi:glycosyltransferase involved in cell wall biosynthesis
LKGGAERIVLNICNELESRKEHEVLLITFSADNAYTFLTETIQWKVVNADVVPSITGKAKIEVDELQKVIDDFQPDVIHAHLFKSIMVLSQIDYTKASYFFHFHDNMPQLAKFSFGGIAKKEMWTNLYERRFVLKAFANRQVTAIAISEDTMGYVVRVLPRKWWPKLMFNAIDFDHFYAELPRQNNSRLAMIGSFVQKKNQLLAIQTAQVLKSRGMSIELNLIGDGPLRSELEEYVQSNDLSESVIFHGAIDHPEVILKESTIYLHTAKIEPFGLVLLEAMAAGLPVVCTDGGGNKDLIEEGENGFLVEEFDPELLADKVEYLLNNPDDRLKMGKTAQDFGRAYDIQHYVKHLVDFYKIMVAKRKRNS